MGQEASANAGDDDAMEIPDGEAGGATHYFQEYEIVRDNINPVFHQRKKRDDPTAVAEHNFNIGKHLQELRDAQEKKKRGNAVVRERSSDSSAFSSDDDDGGGAVGKYHKERAAIQASKDHDEDDLVVEVVGEAEINGRLQVHLSEFEERTVKWFLSADIGDVNSFMVEPFCEGPVCKVPVAAFGRLIQISIIGSRVDRAVKGFEEVLGDAYDPLKPESQKIRAAGVMKRFAKVQTMGPVVLPQGWLLSMSHHILHEEEASADYDFASAELREGSFQKVARKTPATLDINTGGSGVRSISGSVSGTVRCPTTITVDRANKVLWSVPTPEDPKWVQFFNDGGGYNVVPFANLIACLHTTGDGRPRLVLRLRKQKYTACPLFLDLLTIPEEEETPGAEEWYDRSGDGEPENLTAALAQCNTWWELSAEEEFFAALIFVWAEINLVQALLSWNLNPHLILQFEEELQTILLKWCELHKANELVKFTVVNPTGYNKDTVNR